MRFLTLSLFRISLPIWVSQQSILRIYEILLCIMHRVRRMYSAFGDASKMGKVLGTAPAAEAGVMQGSFRGDINSFLQITPSGLGQPRHILTKTV
mmetsp:Transcript_3784/g.10018  ORF Transcript_3784/g.10018 Transcript_3784/m.10018 type:complete len:95 (-) Transcript_3784:265-549(-)